MRAVTLGTRPINNKSTTNIYGLMVEPYALDKYPNVLERTITVLKKYPAESEYAKMMTAFSEDQLQKVNAAEDVDAYERVEGRQIEEALQQARAELQLATDMLQYNIWEPLVEAAPEGQWKWPWTDQYQFPL